MQTPKSTSIQDLLLSEPTTTLVERLGLRQALFHVRAFGGRKEHGQRVLALGLKQRDGATFIEVEVVSRVNPRVVSLLLVEAEWDLLAQGRGSEEMSAGSHDARFALAEIEGRLRQDPALADSYPGTNGQSVGAAAAAASQPPPAGPAVEPKGAGTGTAEPPRPAASTPMDAPVAVRTNGRHPSGREGVQDGEPTPEEMEADGTPREVFKEQPPAQG